MKRRLIMVLVLSLNIYSALYSQQAVTVNYRDIYMLNTKNVGGFTVLIGNMKEETDSAVRQIDFRKFDLTAIKYFPFNDVWDFLESDTIYLPAGNTKLSFEWKFQSSNLSNVLKADSTLMIEHQVFDIDSQKVILVALQANVKGEEVPVYDSLSGKYIMKMSFSDSGVRSFEINSNIQRHVVLRIRVNTDAFTDTTNLEWYTESSNTTFQDSSDYFKNDPYLINILPPFITNTITLINPPAISETNFLLEQNYPNPFNPTTTIQYSIPGRIAWKNFSGRYTLNENSNEKVVLKVYDILGREISTLVNKHQDPGSYVVQFNAGNLPSGIYFYELKYGNYNQIRKMILLR